MRTFSPKVLVLFTCNRLLAGPTRRVLALSIQGRQRRTPNFLRSLVSLGSLYPLARELWKSPARKYRRRNKQRGGGYEKIVGKRHLRQVETAEPIPTMDTPAAQPPAVETVAETWHTVVLLIFIVGWVYFGRARFFYLRGHPSFNQIAFYARMILWESALVGYIAWGVHRRGGSLRAIIGGRWDSAKKVFIDFGVAALFWFGSILCLAVLAATLLGLGTPPVPEVTRTVPTPQGPRSVQVPRAVNALAPRSSLEIPVWIALCLVVGFCEEIIFRGYLQRQFAAWTNRPIAILLSAALFGWGHGYQGRTMQIVLGFFGLFFGILAEMRKSLRPGMLAHAWQDLIAGLAWTLLRRFAGG